MWYGDASFRPPPTMFIRSHAPGRIGGVAGQCSIRSFDPPSRPSCDPVWSPPRRTGAVKVNIGSLTRKLPLNAHRGQQVSIGLSLSPGLSVSTQVSFVSRAKPTRKLGTGSLAVCSPSGRMPRSTYAAVCGRVRRQLQLPRWAPQQRCRASTEALPATLFKPEPDQH